MIDMRHERRTTMHRAPAAALALLAVLALAPARAGAACNHDGQRAGAEECDGADLGGFRCTDLCFDGGTLACSGSCTFDTAGCCGCGNGRLEKAPQYPCNEVCDGTDLDGKTCQTITPPYVEGGTLGCKATCDEFDRSACWHCGNGRKEGPEACDGSDFGGAGLDQCTGPWPEHGGPLACTAGGAASDPATQWPNGCTIDRQFCWVCGNGVIDPGTYVIDGRTLQEQCDDGNLVEGDGCSATCQRECGDGIVQLGESCDDGNAVANDGCTSCGGDIWYFGGNAESWDQCTMRWAVEAPYAAGSQAAVSQQANGFTVTCRDGVAPCDRDASANQCTFLVFYCMNRNALQIGACFPNNIDLLEILPATTLDSAGRATVLASFDDTFRRIGGATTVTLTGTAVDPEPAVTQRSMCGALSVVVPRSAGASGTRVLALRATENLAPSPNRTDTDQVTFVCQP
jgi:cysteine-rich repeat protein